MSRLQVEAGEVTSWEGDSYAGARHWRVGLGLACVALMGVSARAVFSHASLSDAAKPSSQVAFKLRSDAWAVPPHSFKPSDTAKPLLEPQAPASRPRASRPSVRSGFITNSMSGDNSYIDSLSQPQPNVAPTSDRPYLESLNRPAPAPERVPAAEAAFKTEEDISTAAADAKAEEERWAAEAAVRAEDARLKVAAAVKAQEERLAARAAVKAEEDRFKAATVPYLTEELQPVWRQPELSERAQRHAAKLSEPMQSQQRHAAELPEEAQRDQRKPWTAAAYMNGDYEASPAEDLPADIQQTGTVQTISKKDLEAKIAANEAMLVAFYLTRQCEACERFVTAGPDGTIKSAPLEKLNAAIVAKGGPKVFKVDADHGIPTGFDVHSVPKVFRVSSQSAITEFTGNRGDSAALMAFAMAE